MSEIITVTNHLPLLYGVNDDCNCLFKDCTRKAFILIYVEGEIEALRAMGYPPNPTETIVRISLCRQHYHEYQTLKKCR